MFILKSYSSPIPANYFYVQTIGIQHRFPTSPVIEDLAKTVSSFRIANKLPRASLAESLEDIDQFTCARLQNNGKWCYNTDGSFESNRANHRFFKGNCSSCGTVLKNP